MAYCLINRSPSIFLLVIDGHNHVFKTAYMQTGPARRSLSSEMRSRDASVVVTRDIKMSS